MANRAFSRLIALVTPSSDNYFILFNELAACSVRGAKVLAQMSSVNDPVAFEQHFQEIRKIESEADEFTRTILLSLHKTFITPFDRSEIKDLAMALDDMLDYTEDIPQRAELYGPGEFTPKCRRSARLRCAPPRRFKKPSLCCRICKTPSAF
jgi:hypothetical protein